MISPQKQYPHSPLEASMTRTFNPGYANYMGDGSGRDSYIILNNGGLTRLDKNYMMNRNNRASPDNTVRPFKKPASIKYQSDGSGRDSYVIQNSGGLVYDFRGNRADVVFKGMLREQHKSLVRSSIDAMKGPEITDYLNWKTPKEQYLAKKMATKQRQLIDRLSPTRENYKYNQHLRATPDKTRNQDGNDLVNIINKEGARWTDRRRTQAPIANNYMTNPERL